MESGADHSIVFNKASHFFCLDIPAGRVRDFEQERSDWRLDMKGFPGNRLKRFFVVCMVLVLLSSASVFAMGIWEEGESGT